MSGTFSDYLAGHAAGMSKAAGDISHHAIADIADSYQEILMAHASISPPDGLPVDYDTVTTTSEPDEAVAGMDMA